MTIADLAHERAWSRVGWGREAKHAHDMQAWWPLAHGLRARGGGVVAIRGTTHALQVAMVLKKILCPVDFSDSSREAMHVAVELARKSQAALVLVHVWETPMWSTGYEKQLPSEAMAELLAGEETTLTAWKLEASKLGVGEVAIKFLEGAPWDQIVSTAREDPAIDLIVMGTHGRTGVKRALIGSVAERVVRHAPCAVLVVRTRGTDDK